MKVDTREMSPWADMSRMFSNMKTLTMKVGNDRYVGDADISSVDGAVTVSFPGRKVAKSKPRKAT